MREWRGRRMRWSGRPTRKALAFEALRTEPRRSDHAVVEDRVARQQHAETRVSAVPRRLRAALAAAVREIDLQPYHIVRGIRNRRGAVEHAAVRVRAGKLAVRIDRNGQRDFFAEYRLRTLCVDTRERGQRNAAIVVGRCAESELI